MKTEHLTLLATVVIAFAALAALVLTGQAGLRQDLRGGADRHAGEDRPSSGRTSAPGRSSSRTRRPRSRPCRRRSRSFRPSSSPFRPRSVNSGPGRTVFEPDRIGCGRTCPHSEAGSRWWSIAPTHSKPGSRWWSNARSTGLEPPAPPPAPIRPLRPPDNLRMRRPLLERPGEGLAGAGPPMSMIPSRVALHRHPPQADLLHPRNTSTAPVVKWVNFVANRLAVCQTPPRFSSSREVS